MGTFLNISNHPSDKWQVGQSEAALNLPEIRQIRDVPFPNIPPAASASTVREMAFELLYALQADGLDPAQDVAMVQGEFSFTHHLTCALEALGMRVVVGCSERKAEEITLADGVVRKVSTFDFVQFRQVTLVFGD